MEPTVLRGGRCSFRIRPGRPGQSHPIINVQKEILGVGPQAGVEMDQRPGDSGISDQSRLSYGGFGRLPIPSQQQRNAFRRLPPFGKGSGSVRGPNFCQAGDRLTVKGQGRSKGNPGQSILRIQSGSATRSRPSGSRVTSRRLHNGQERPSQRCVWVGIPHGLGSVHCIACTPEREQDKAPGDEVMHIVRSLDGQPVAEDERFLKAEVRPQNFHGFFGNRQPSPVFSIGQGGANRVDGLGQAAFASAHGCPASVGLGVRRPQRNGCSQMRPVRCVITSLMGYQSGSQLHFRKGRASFVPDLHRC